MRPHLAQAKDSSSIDVHIAAGAIQTISTTIRPQSYFDSTLNEQAIIPSSSTNGICSDGLLDQQVSGVGVALASDSQAPVVVYVSGGGIFGAQSVLLKPGAIFWHGKPFTRLQFGLPYGWLGGGVIRIYVLKEYDAYLSLAPPTGDLIFHRQRCLIFAASDNPSARNSNWPNRFPWPNAVNNLGQAQSSKPVFGVTPTRVRMRLRLGTLGAGGGTLRSVLYQTDDFDLQSDGTGLDGLGTSGLFEDVIFQNYSASGFKVNGTATKEFPEQTADTSIFRTGGDSAIMTFVDMATPNAIGNTTLLDVIRYGVVG